MSTPRPLAPTGAPGLGDPPVAVRAIGRLVERVGEERAPAAVARAYPTLSEAERAAALEAWRVDPEAASPRATWGQALSLALPLGAGAALAADGLLTIGFLILHLVAGESDDPTNLRAPLALLVAILALVPSVLGFALLRLRPWAGRWTALLAALVAVPLAAAAGQGRGVAAALAIAPILLVLVAVVLHPACRRWFTPDGRAAASALPHGPYALAVGATALAGWMLIVLVPKFADVFASLGVALPLPTQVLLSLANHLARWWFTLPALVLLAPLPLLRLPARLERVCAQAAVLGAVVVFGSMVGWILLPIWQLQQAL